MRLVLLCLLPGLAAAQTASDPLAGTQSVQADLDGDGQTETYSLRPGADPTTVDLVAGDGRAGTTYADVAWTGAMAGQAPWLELTPGGSLAVISENTGIGRDRWHMTLTIAHRDGLRVAGVTYEWYDTLDPEAGGTCDLNLLSGRGTVATAAGARAVTAGPAPRLANWREMDGTAALLAPCGIS